MNADARRCPAPDIGVHPRSSAVPCPRWYEVCSLYLVRLHLPLGPLNGLPVSKCSVQKKCLTNLETCCQPTASINTIVSGFLWAGYVLPGCSSIYDFLKEREEKLNETDERKGLSSPGYCDDDRSWQLLTSCA